MAEKRGHLEKINFREYLFCETNNFQGILRGFIFANQGFAGTCMECTSKGGSYQHANERTNESEHIIINDQ